MKRILQLDGVRAVAFLMIFLRHTYDVPLFWAGVDIFFVLSGFLITSILMDAKGKPRAWSHFYERRALRILPTYLVCLAFATYFFQIHWGWNSLWYGLFAMNIAEAFNFGVPGLGILWSLAVEEQFYLFWPFVALRFEPRTVLKVAVALIIAAPVLRGVATPFLSNHWSIYYLMPFRMDLIACGAVMAVLWRQAPDLAVWRRSGLMLMAASGLLFAACAWLFHDFNAGSNSFSFNIAGYTLICGLASGLIAFTLGTEKGWWMRLMTAKPIRWIGLISYTGYLVHAGAIGLITPFGSKIPDRLTAFAFVILYASLSWLYFEKPILRLRPAAWFGARKNQRE
jgi:peptidoglycan/LPS O-acetylase OafA/YrhL